MTYTWVDYVSLLGPTAVALLAAIVVLVGWFVNSNRALNNEIKKEARQYKIDMFSSIFDFHERYSRLISDYGKVVVEDDELINLSGIMESKVRLYGDGEEILLVKELIDSFATAAINIGKKNVEEASSHFNISDKTGQLLSLSQRKFRKELRLETPKEISKVLESGVKK